MLQIITTGALTVLKVSMMPNQCYFCSWTSFELGTLLSNSLITQYVLSAVRGPSFKSMCT